MTHIFTATQLAGHTQKALQQNDPTILQNVVYLAERLYQDSKEDLRNISDQPWPDRLTDAHFKVHNYGVYDQSIKDNLEELPQDFLLTTITFRQVVIINQLLNSLYEQVYERPVFDIVDYVLNLDDIFDANQTDTKDLITEIK